MQVSKSNLYLRETGSRDDPAILFLHASPLSGRMWEPQLDRLPEYHCLAPDLPGHGRSACIPVDMPDTVRRLIHLIHESTSDGRAHVVGLSYGGVVAQALMIAGPEVVDHVILSGTGTRMSKPLFWASMLNEPILRLLRPEQMASLIALQFGVPAQYRAAMREDFGAFSARTVTDVMRTYMEIEMPSETRSPTLVAVGGKETVYAKRAARALARGVPGAKGVLVPGYGHLWNLGAPDLFAQTVRAWVRDEPLPEGLVRLT